MAQGRSTKIISMIKWIRTSRLSTKKWSDLSLLVEGAEDRRPASHVYLQRAPVRVRHLTTPGLVFQPHRLGYPLLNLSLRTVQDPQRK